MLFTEQMYEALRMQWATSFSAFLALLYRLVSYVFHFEGPTIRKYRRYAFLDVEHEEKLSRAEQV